LGRHAPFQGETRRTPGQAASWARKRRRQAEKQAALQAEADRRGVSIAIVERVMARETKDRIKAAEREARERAIQLQAELEGRRRHRISQYGF
jgi:SOS response regulatory protein OraA/RecX